MQESRTALSLAKVCFFRRRRPHVLLPLLSSSFSLPLSLRLTYSLQAATIAGLGLGLLYWFQERLVRRRDARLVFFKRAREKDSLVLSLSRAIVRRLDLVPLFARSLSPPLPPLHPKPPAATTPTTTTTRSTSRASRESPTTSRSTRTASASTTRTCGSRPRTAPSCTPGSSARRARAPRGARCSSSSRRMRARWR